MRSLALCTILLVGCKATIPALQPSFIPTAPPLPFPVKIAPRAILASNSAVVDTNEFFDARYETPKSYMLTNGAKSATLVFAGFPPFPEPSKEPAHPSDMVVPANASVLCSTNLVEWSSGFSQAPKRFYILAP